MKFGNLRIRVVVCVKLPRWRAKGSQRSTPSVHDTRSLSATHHRLCMSDFPAILSAIRTSEDTVANARSQNPCPWQFEWQTMIAPCQIEKRHFLLEELVDTLANVVEGDDRRGQDVEFHLPNLFEVILHIWVHSAITDSEQSKDMGLCNRLNSPSVPVAETLSIVAFRC